MRLHLLLLLPLYSLFLFTSCSTEKDASAIQIVVSPDSLALHVESGNKLLFTITAKTINEPLTRIQICQKTAKTGSIVLLDSMVHLQKYNYDYHYTIPASIAEKQIELTFIARTASDYSVSTKYLFLDSVNTPLKESTSHVLYRFENLKNSAFSIFQRHTVSFPTDSLLSDIYDAQNGVMAPDQYARSWKSGTGKQFVRFNDFNYAEATVQSLQSCYANASKRTTVEGIQENDVIMIGDKNSVLGVIKIIALLNENGTANDRTIFNLKYIE